MTYSGHDTTGTALPWTILEIARHPDVQQKVLEEIDTIFGDDLERQIEEEDLKKLVYLEMVFKEALRVHSPIGLIARRIQKDFEILGYKIAKVLKFFSFNIIFKKILNLSRVRRWPSQYKRFISIPLFGMTP